MFASSDMKYMVKILGSIMIPGGHEHVFCSTLPSSLRYKAFASEKRSSKKVPEAILERPCLRARRVKV